VASAARHRFANILLTTGQAGLVSPPLIWTAPAKRSGDGALGMTKRLAAQAVASLKIFEEKC
jgi:hypothetical protein